MTTASPRLSAIEGVSLQSLADRFGTPLYVYSRRALVENFDRLRDAFAELDPLIAFSVKSNGNAAILRTLLARGAGLDIVSGGELARGLAAGADPSKIVFAGVGKTREEIAAALRARIFLFNVESEPEAEAISSVAVKLKKRARAALRVNPDVDPSTHHYITTGKKENKFGVPFERARAAFDRVARLRGVEAIGLHAHIGSQIVDPGAYAAALERLLELRARLERDGHAIEALNLGGGFGIDYESGRKPMDVKKLAARLTPMLRPLGARVIFEPGRSIVGPAGWLLTRAIYIKQGAGRRFLIVDAAMNDLIRPSLYSAHHRISAVGRARAGRAAKYDVVGPICESGDFLGKDRPFVAPDAGDLFVIHDCGAYGFAMASNYNSRPRAAEVMVRGRRAETIRERETIEDLTRLERTPDFITRD